MPKGGKRQGAGRKPIGTAPKTKINITVDCDLLRCIDALSDNRSQWIEAAIRQAIESKQP